MNKSRKQDEGFEGRKGMRSPDALWVWCAGDVVGE